MRVKVSILLLVVLVTVSGCTGLPGDSNDSANVDSVYIEGEVGSQKISDASTTMRRHLASLIKGRSYTFNQELRVRYLGERSSRNSDGLKSTTTAKVDLKSSEAVINTFSNDSYSSRAFNTSVYIDPRGASWMNRSGSTALAHARNYNLDEFLEPSILGLIVSGINWTRQDTLTIGGETLHRYRAENPNLSVEGDPRRRFLGRYFTLGNITDFESELLVSTDGLIRKVKYNVSWIAEERSSETGSLRGWSRYTANYTDIGETGIRVPSWVDDVENRLTNQGWADRTETTSEKMWGDLGSLNATMNSSFVFYAIIGSSFTGLTWDTGYAYRTQEAENSRISYYVDASLPNVGRVNNASLTIEFNSSKSEGSQDISIYRYDYRNITFQRIPTSINLSKQEATARINHSGTYVVLQGYQD